MLYKFKAAITRGGHVITPDRIEITPTSVIWKRRNKYLIGVDSISISRDKISSVELDHKYWGVDIIIHGFGGATIYAKNFTKSDAQQIQNILTSQS